MSDIQSKRPQLRSVNDDFSRGGTQGDSAANPSAESTTPPVNGNVPQACAYISAMATELQNIALDNKLPVIAYFLDMVRVEVESILSLSRTKA